MKRTLQFTSLIFLLLPSLVAQETFNQNSIEEQWDTETRTWVPERRNQAAYDEAGRYIGAYSETLKEGEWIQTYYSEFSYHGTSDQIDRRETFSYEPQFDRTLSLWRNFEYTEEGWPLLTETKTIRTDLEGIPYDSSYSLRTWSYGTNGEVLTEERLWDTSLQTTEYTYDASGCETRRLVSRWSNRTPYRQVRTIRNTNCDILEEIEEVWANPGAFWEFEGRTVYTYTSGSLSEVIRYERDLTLDLWEAQERRVYSQRGDTLQVLTYAWDEMTNDWETEAHAYSLTVTVEDVIRLEEKKSSSLWTVRTFNQLGREISNTHKVKDEEEWVDLYADTHTYDEKDRLIEETRSWDYDKDLALYKRSFILEKDYIESQVLLQVNTIVSQRSWIDSERRYEFANSTSSLTYDYYCNDLLRTRTVTRNGVNQSRRRIQVDQSLKSACGDGPDNPLTVYPNPAQDRVTVKIDGVSRKPSSVEIMDLQGRVAKVRNFEKGLFLVEIDITDLVPGTYIARVQKEGVYNYFKFIKTAD